jgi:hypothetical protein
MQRFRSFRLHARAMRPALRQLFAAAIVGTLAQSASAQLYRWVDAQGVVNYGDTPPSGARQITPLNPDKSGVSVVPGLSREELDRAKKSAEQVRIERLEREVDALREDSRTRPAPAPAPATEQVYVPYYYDGRARPPHRPRPDPRPPKPDLPVDPPGPPLFTRPR